MNLYLISQSVNDDYDTYSDAVVAASDEETARRTHPSDYAKRYDEEKQAWMGVYSDGPSLGQEYIFASNDNNHSWTSIDNVQVKLIGIAVENTEQGIICASFHAG